MGADRCQGRWEEGGFISVDPGGCQLPFVFAVDYSFLYDPTVYNPLSSLCLLSLFGTREERHLIIE